MYRVAVGVVATGLVAGGAALATIGAMPKSNGNSQREERNEVGCMDGCCYQGSGPRTRSLAFASNATLAFACVDDLAEACYPHAPQS